MKRLNTILVCGKCGHKGSPRLRWKEGRGVRHLGGYCENCGAWIRWLPQVTPWIDLAPALQRSPEPELPLFEEVERA